MWLYRAYSGNLYHNGEQTLTLSSFTQGDFITCVLDMEARTISFGKNGEVNTEIHNTDCSQAKSSARVSHCWLPVEQEPKLAFEDVDATELYPCVMFYSSNPGEKVRQHQYSHSGELNCSLYTTTKATRAAAIDISVIGYSIDYSGD